MLYLSMKSVWKLSDEFHFKECSVPSVWPGWITKHLCEACIDSVSPFQPSLSMNSQCALSWCAQIPHDTVTSRAALHKTLYDIKCAVCKTLWYNVSRSHLCFKQAQLKIYHSPKIDDGVDIFFKFLEHPFLDHFFKNFKLTSHLNCYSFSTNSNAEN